MIRLATLVIAVVILSQYVTVSPAMWCWIVFAVAVDFVIWVSA
jgi:hypothetical protein